MKWTLPRPSLPVLVIVAASGALLVEPALWLIQTWTDPTWDSDGAWVALACAALVGRAVLSGPAGSDPRGGRVAVLLLFGTALIRLGGRVLAINVVGALALVFDVAALGMALRLSRRPWALHPGALAALSAFALPLEPILQRVLGFPLRLVSTVVAHSVLAPFAEIGRVGTLLVSDGQALAVDLPCSGARGLTLLAALALAAACRRRPGARGVIGAVLLVPVGALVANTLRIVAVYGGTRHGLPVLAEPWHGLLGLVSLAVGAAPLVAVAARWPRRGAAAPARPVAAPVSAAAPVARPARRPAVAAALLGVAAAVALLAPARPLDVSGAVAALALPTTLGPWHGAAVAPDAAERAYFERFGGRVAKAVYRDGRGAARQVILVRTTSPLRHLHAPDRCLVGAGHTVTRVGVRPPSAGALPTVVWRSVDPEGRAWRVEASFVGPGGEAAAGVSEVVWSWLFAGGGAWTLVERVSPWEACPADPGGCAAFEAALFAALDVGAERPGVRERAVSRACEGFGVRREDGRCRGARKKRGAGNPRHIGIFRRVSGGPVTPRAPGSGRRSRTEESSQAHSGGSP